ncbi:hypothetical protein TRICI_003130 [Trichomonascus ciferrii]|uniref:Vacuolar protein sorting-associated protein 35 n=1 Tax=Trichomonascus ciferrii TaxID=44093 RepID=A0A642V5Y6_9ASCO|nr:hypothetical protein TRICI_003130 [Trichomonascus ciferrii]
MSNSGQPLSSEDQAKQLEESLAFIRQQETLMRKCLESKGKLLDAIKHASTFLAELRTSSLTPKQYYELYIAVFDALSYLGAYLKEDHHNHHLADIYELVQYAGNIVPRLYLMITVGTVYMSIPDAPVKEIMKDMMEMCRGVQHPVRGLFLRYYLSQGCREYLPVGTSEGPEGNLQDSIQFTITNFIEMNKLWVRLQHQGHSRERDKRTTERKELQILVGSNLVRLSQLEGIDKDYYRTSILPSILEQVVQCRDVIAQEYLLDVVVQVFPDEFHLHTLDLFLNATCNLNPSVSIKKIILALVYRLADYAQRLKENGGDPAVTVTTKLEKLDINGQQKAANSENNEQMEEEAELPTQENGEEEASKPTVSEEEATEEVNLFEVFWKHLENILEIRPEMSQDDINALLVGITRLCLNCYADNLDYIDRILSFAKEHSHEGTTNGPGVVGDNLQKLLLELIDYFPSLLTVLSIPSYVPLLSSQPLSTQKCVAGAVLGSVLKDENKIETVDDVNGVFGLLGVVIRDGSSVENTSSQQEVELPGGPSTGVEGGKPSKPEKEDGEPSLDVLTDQSKLAKVVHLLYSSDTDVHSKLLRAARQALSEGKEKIKYTYPALVTAAFKLVRRYRAKSSTDSEWSEKIGSTFKFIQKVVNDIYQVGKADLALRLYVNAASIADQVKAQEASYEFYAQAFTIYEEAISDSRSQFQAICIVAGALQSSRNFSHENYDTLVSKCALYGSKLLKKPDQCRAVYIASHLWWATEIQARGEDETKDSDLFKDEERVLECLQRALRVADGCMDVAVSVELFVEILNRYLYFFDRGSKTVTVKYINGLIDLIQTNLSNNSDGGISDSPRKHFERTLEYITNQKQVDEKFQQIVW